MLKPAARADWFQRRRSGILLPLSALGGEGGDGALGRAGQFLDFLGRCGFGIWQMLPIHPTDQYASPYQSWSAFAAEPRYIDGTLAVGADAGDYAVFRERCAYWLDDYALYAAIKEVCGNLPWWLWPDPLKSRDPAALASFSAANAAAVEAHRLLQYRFELQWRAVRRIAAHHNVLLLGDLPLFIAHDSADAWAHPGFFQLDDSGQTQFVAGVPPDYFSSTGQRWGNPVYRWTACAADGFSWWVKRMQRQMDLFDVVRIDHFRGLEAVWEIPADCPTAERGEWKPAPGAQLLNAVRESLGALPCIAEDLGTITPPVEQLRKRFALPGIKVLQFAFDSDANNPYLPHNHVPDAVIYTGTHDNNTTLGWFNSLDAGAHERILEYLGRPGIAMPWPLIGLALASVCRFAIVPMQDILALGAEHRTNTPGTVDGNWRWRLNWEWVKPDLPGRLRYLNEIYGRL